MKTIKTVYLSTKIQKKLYLKKYINNRTAGNMFDEMAVKYLKIKRIQKEDNINEQNTLTLKIEEDVLKRINRLIKRYKTKPSFSQIVELIIEEY